MAIINGTALNDTLLGDEGGVPENDTITGFGGFDRLYGYGGDDILYGNEGDDRLYGGDGNNDLYGGEGNDLLQVVGSGANYLDGGAGDDTLKGNSGADILDGGAGDDYLQGGTGGDNYSFIGTFGHDTVSDQAGNDNAFFSVAQDLTIDLSNTTGVTDGSSNAVYWGANTIENVYSGTGNDTISGSAVANYIDANNGHDSVRGGGGDDSLYGRYGNDTLRGQAGNDLLNGAHGDDNYVLDNNWGHDSIEDNVGTDTLDAFNVSNDLTVRLISSAGAEVTDGTSTVNWIDNVIENVVSGSGNDDIIGNSKRNHIEGRAGNDTINGWTGNDTLQGGEGNDTYVFKKGDGFDTLIDSGLDTDTADVVQLGNNIAQEDVAFWFNGANLEIGYVGSNTDKINIIDQTATVNSIERFELSNGNYLTNTEVNQVVQDMITYANDNGITLNNLNDVKNNADLMAIVNGSWHA